MNAFITLCCCLSFSTLAMAQSNPLQPFRWENRILLVFADNSQQPTFQQQLEQFKEDESGLKERDLVVFQLLADEGKAPQQQQLSTKSVQALRQKYGVKYDEYTIILIGKDGGEKLRSKELLSLEKLYNTIDVMPMRRAEMRRNKKEH